MQCIDAAATQAAFTDRAARVFIEGMRTAPTFDDFKACALGFAHSSAMTHRLRGWAHADVQAIAKTILACRRQTRIRMRYQYILRLVRDADLAAGKLLAVHR